MTTSDIIILSFFIFCFVGLAAVMAWGDYQTRDIAKESRARALAELGSLVPELEPDVIVRETRENKPARTPVHA